MARAVRKKQIVESDPESDSESEEEDDDESEDERPARKKGRASTSTTYSRKGAAAKGKAPAKKTPVKSGSSGKGKRRAAVSDEDDDDDEVLQVEEARDDDDDDDDDGNEAEGDGGRPGKQAKDKSGPDVSRYAQQVVRLALFAEASQGMLKREDINKKVLGKDTRSFADVLSIAQRILRKTFALELVEVRSKGRGLGGAEDVAVEADRARSQAAAGSQRAARRGTARKKGIGGGKKRPRGEDESESKSDDDDDDDDDDDGGTANGRVSNRKKSSGPARAFILRSLLPREIVQAIAIPNPPQDPGMAHGAGASPSGPILDFDREGRMALMGILYVVLALILVNGRRLPDDHLKAALKKLDLHLSSRLPTSQTALGGQPLTLDGLLTSCVRHGYLERAKAAKGVFGATSQAASSNGGSGMRGARGPSSRRKGDEGEEDVVWAWGARSEVEITERGLTELIGDLYLGPLRGEAPAAAAPEEEEEEGGAERLTADERQARAGRRAKERERLRVDVRRAAGGELQGSVEEYP